MITIEDHVTQLSLLLSSDFQAHIDSVNSYRQDMELIPYDSNALSLYDMREMPSYPIGYMIDVDGQIVPITSGKSCLLSAKQVTFRVLVVVPDDAEHNFRQKAFRYCEVLELWYSNSVRTTAMFKDSVYNGIQVSPPLVYIGGGGQQVIATHIEFSLVLAD